MLSFSRFSSQALKPSALLGIPLLAFVLFQWGDIPVTTFFYEQHLRRFLALALLSKLGVSVLYLVLFLVAGLFSRYIYRNRLWEVRFFFLWVSLFFTDGICLILKMLLGRARPMLWFDAHFYGFYGFKTEALYWSFPSGHTTTWMTLAAGLAVLFPKEGGVFLLVGFLMSFLRVMLISHYLSDVIFSSWLVILEMGLLLHWLRRIQYFSPIFEKK